jgi:hypothetical protein
LDQASKPTYYGLTSCQMNVKEKEKVEKQLKYFVSCIPQAFSTYD